MLPGPTELLADLRAVLGPTAVLDDPATLRRFAVDVTRRFSGEPAAVARPANTPQVAAVLEICRRHSRQVVIQGGNTGLVGGAAPRDGEVVLSTERLDDMEPVDETAGDVTVGAGVVLSRLQEHVAAAGFEVPVDHGGRDGATIGGMVATNAGGSYAVRHGMTGRHVRGLEVVLPDGAVLTRMSGLSKDNAGPDLTRLFVGSEGIFGVVTRARIGLVPRPRRRLTARLQVDALEQAMVLLSSLRRHAPGLEAIEFWDPESSRLVSGAGSERWSLLLQSAGGGDLLPELEAAFTDAGIPLEQVSIAEASSARRELWAEREAIPERLNRSFPLKLDVSVPLVRIADFCREVRERSRGWEGVQAHLFGHLGDGNVHVNLLGVPGDGERIAEEVLGMVAARGGSISAEHGVGVAKAAYLGLTRSEVEIGLMRRLKQLLDPDQLLNRGRVLRPGGDGPLDPGSEVSHRPR